MPRVTRRGDDVVVETNELVLALRKDGRGYQQYVGTRSDGSSFLLRSEPAPEVDGDVVRPLFDTVKVIERSEEIRLELSGARDGHRFTSTLTVNDREPLVRVTVEDRFATGRRLAGIRSSYELLEPTASFVFAPYVRPFDDNVISQSAFKAPAVAWVTGRTLVFIVADVNHLRATRPALPAYLDFDAAARPPRLGFGLITHAPSGTLYFSHQPGDAIAVDAGTLTYSYYLVVRPDVAPEDAAGVVARFLWATLAHEDRRDALPQVVPFEIYARRGLAYALSRLWTEFDLDGRRCGAIRSGLRVPNDVWFQNQHNALDSARALQSFGERWGDDELRRKAQCVKELALASPSDRGLFLTIFTGGIRFGVLQPQWTASHWMWSPEFAAEFGLIERRSLARLINWDLVYHTVSCSTAAYTMLRWYQEVEADARLLQRCQTYADYLLRVQQQSGAIPSWIYRDSLDIELLLKDSVDSAASGLFLAEMYRVSRDGRYLTAAQRVADFILERVRPDGRWQDYETFFDSLGKPVGFFDDHTRQYAQTTGGIYWTAELLRILSETTADPRWLQEGVRVADYLSLFQAVWAPHFLSMHCFGGFAVGNSHPAWSDARQQLFGRLFLGYYALTRDPDYLTRGVAAVRASLPLMFMPENQRVSRWFADGPEGWCHENYAHRGQDGPAISSSYDWGLGNCLTSLGLILRDCGSVVVDVDRAWAHGIDGTVAGKCRIEGTQVHLELEDRVDPGRPLTITVLGTTDRELELFVNGAFYGSGRMHGGRLQLTQT